MKDQTVLIEDFGDLPLVIRVERCAIVPLLAGAVCGFLLGISEVAWWISQVVVTLGGIGGGTDHVHKRGAAVRGLVAGTMLGIGIAAAHAASGDPALAPFPVPALLIAVPTAIGGIVSALLGAGPVRSLLFPARSASL